MRCVPKQSAVLHHFPVADVLVSPLLICSGAQWGWDSAAVGLGWGWWGWAGAGLGPSCILDVHWIELCILEGKEKTHILRVLWRFRALYQKAALMESLGGGSVKQKFPIASQAAFVLSSLLVTFPAMECIGGEPRARRAFWGTFGTD